MRDEFKSVKGESGPIWEPKQTGNKKDDTLKALKAGDTSWIVGYFLGTETINGQNGDSNVHKLKMDSVGDEKHIIGDLEDSKEVSIWGTGVLDDQMSKIKPGQFICVEWKGKVKPKKGSNPYHTWDVGVNHAVEPLSVGNQAVSNPAPAVEENEAAASVADNGGDDDDMPF